MINKQMIPNIGINYSERVSSFPRMQSLDDVKNVTNFEIDYYSYSISDKLSSMAQIRLLIKDLLYDYGVKDLDL